MAKFNVPKKVNVLGHDYRVVWVSPEAIKTPGAAAEMEWPARIIRIDRLYRSKRNAKVAWLYLMHEIKHAHQFESGMYQLLDKQALELDADGFSSFISSLKNQGVI